VYLLPGFTWGILHGVMFQLQPGAFGIDTSRGAESRLMSCHHCRALSGDPGCANSSGSRESIGKSRFRQIAASVTAVARFSLTMFAVIASILPTGCTSLEAYSVRQAEDCGAASVCTVYGTGGESLSPCVWTNRQAIYPGDPRWPYTTPGICDTVRDGKVVSSRKPPSLSQYNPSMTPPE